jgi:purine-cytosine permease-like protein
MTTKIRDLSVETRSIEYIPLSERHGKVWHLWPVWFSGDANLATVATGVVGVALGGHLLWMAIAVVSGCAFGTFFMAFHSTQGPQLGLPQMIQSRPQFGYLGALLVWGVALIAYIGFNAFNQVLAAQTMGSLYGSAPAATIIIFSLLSAALAAVGYDLIHIAQRWVAYVVIAALVVFTAAAAVSLQLPVQEAALGPFPRVAFLAQFFAAASYQISWSIYVSDYSRYLPRDVGVRSSFCWTYFGALIGGAWMMLLGTLAAALYPTVEVTTSLRMVADSVLPGFGRPLMLASLLGLIAITSLNYYGASLTLLSVMDCFKPTPPSRFKRLATLLLSMLVANLLAFSSSSGFVAKFGDFLAVLLYLFTPWTAINLVDFYLVRKGAYSVREIFNAHGMYGAWNWRGLTAYGVGFVSMIPFFSTGVYTGPVAALIYIWACRSMDLKADLLQARAADVGLD